MIPDTLFIPFKHSPLCTAYSDTYQRGEFWSLILVDWSWDSKPDLYISGRLARKDTAVPHQTSDPRQKLKSDEFVSTGALG